MNNLLLSLQPCCLFKNKSLDEIEKLFSHVQYKTASYKENEIIFSPVQKADRIGIILSGSVDIQKLFPSGKVVIIERKKRFDLIAASSIFSKIDVYPDAVSVSKPCTILFILKSDLLNLFHMDKDFMLNFIESVSNETLMLKHKIGILSLSSIQEKIAGYLIYSNKTYNSYSITLPFSKKAWAEYMNVSRTSLSRELRHLETEGILSFEKRKIHIHDLTKLEKIVSL
ncbi:Crp/Fnr family transcriptional regulator [Vallitalea pronyensis]|uniref:Crp/Fnr family transcriptional regulator n=1 Tax=Vallitalea pronyensis TaxID=1348613 RepID=A0A8J8ML82_9FIRM|nr:Crp/Fnr family transcriptional regulator [Vallitalea pronyensis]QUI23912.1 Crp/Fnr family transcriptional regulator [Vallitalea pronyensis]